LVAYISQNAQLLPGDLILTGSPAGNGIHSGRLLRDGDVMDGSVNGLSGSRHAWNQTGGATAATSLSVTVRMEGQ
jgi:2-keto-4-pentenoate hydratase/2-oxohepta-3-ene-1,7-dioic acid hydratase in catechol pathway